MQYNRLTGAALFSILIGGLFFASPLTALANGPAPRQSQAVYEIHFMTRMIDHHAMAVMMGSLCEDRAIHPELLQLCENIVTSQSEQIQMMQSWLADWYGIDYAPEMTPGNQQKIDQMATMSGAEFEIMFMQMMIRHHHKAVIEGSTCVDRAYHPEVIALCENIVASQSEQIAQMQTWLGEWYGDCHPQ
jgi:uncharacterized protein (DUF305 family)